MGFIGILLGIPGIVLLIAAFVQWMQNRSYAAWSERVMATVTNKTSRKTKQGRSYELYVTYEVDGKTYEKWVASKPEQYDGIYNGQQIEILYKPQAPKRSVQPFQLDPKNVRVILILGLALLAVGVVLFLLGRS